MGYGDDVTPVNHEEVLEAGRKRSVAMKTINFSLALYVIFTG